MGMESKSALNATHMLVTNSVVLNLFYSSTNIKKCDLVTTETVADRFSDFQPGGWGSMSSQGGISGSWG